LESWSNNEYLNRDTADEPEGGDDDDEEEEEGHLH
jgi:hypothetical protein